MANVKEHVQDAYYQHQFVYPHLILQTSTILGDHPLLHIVTMHPKAMNMYMNKKPTTKAQVIFFKNSHHKAKTCVSQTSRNSSCSISSLNLASSSFIKTNSTSQVIAKFIGSKHSTHGLDGQFLLINIIWSRWLM